jgi:hypothetical protein
VTVDASLAKGKTATELVRGKAAELTPAEDSLRLEVTLQPEECAAVVFE